MLTHYTQCLPQALIPREDLRRYFSGCTVGGIRLTGIRPVIPVCKACISSSILDSSRANANSNFRIRFDSSFSLDFHSSLEEISWKVSLVPVANILRLVDRFAAA
jgi:hypothetical protein